MNVFDLIEDITTYLGSQGVGTLGENLYAGAAPGDAPKTTTVVYATGGPNLPGNPTKTPFFAVQHRNTKINSGLSKVSEINSMLDEAWNKLDRFTGRILAQSEPGAHVKTSSGLFLFTLNYVLTSGQ